MGFLYDLLLWDVVRFGCFLEKIFFDNFRRILSEVFAKNLRWFPKNSSGKFSDKFWEVLLQIIGKNLRWCPKNFIKNLGGKSLIVDSNAEEFARQFSEKISYDFRRISFEIFGKTSDDLISLEILFSKNFSRNFWKISPTLLEDFRKVSPKCLRKHLQYDLFHLNSLEKKPRWFLKNFIRRLWKIFQKNFIENLLEQSPMV